MTESFLISNTLVNPGEQKTIKIPLPALYSHASVSMPVHIIHGKQKGPVLFLSAAVHGDELNGVEIIRRVLNKKYIRSIKGTLIAIPIVNVYGFLNQTRYLPDRRDLNRTFPGSEKGSMASRLAHTFMDEIVKRSTHGIDLHTGAINRENLPQIRAKVLGAPETEALALAFGTSVIINSELRDGSLRGAVMEYGVPMLLYEAGEALRFDEVAIRIGVRGVLNVMRYLGMIPKRRMRKIPTKPIIANDKIWMRASQSGILRAKAALGAQVKRDEILGWIADPFGKHEAEVVSPVSGIVIGKANLPLVYEGEALFHIAKFDELEKAAKSVEAIQNAFDPDLSQVNTEEPPIL